MSLCRTERLIKKVIEYDNIIKDQHLEFIFYDKIAELSGEGEILPHHEFYINYEEKYCIFNDFDIDYETGEKIYTNYKIIIRPSAKKIFLSLNIFIFNKIYL